MTRKHSIGAILPRVWVVVLALAILASGAAAAPPSMDTTRNAELVSQGQQKQRPDVRVALSSGLAKIGERVSINVTVTTNDRRRGIDVRFLPMPEVDGLNFGAAQEAGTRTSVNVGRRGTAVAKTTTTYVIPVQPQRGGEFVIPPLEFTVAGERMTLPTQPLQLKIVEDLEASQLLFFDRAPTPDSVYEGQPFELDFEFGWDAGMRMSGVLLQIPWWGQLDGLLEVGTITTGSEADFPLGPGRRTLRVERLGSIKRGGRDFVAFRLRRRFVATRKGTLTFSRAIFEFDRQQTQGSAFSRGRTRSYYRPIDPFAIEVKAVPEEGRPIEWTGAVGSIEVAREVQRRDVDAGDVIPFELRYTGSANLEFFEAPELDRIDGFDRFRVLGEKDEPTPYERVITYDLVPLDASITQIPSVPLSVFSTDRGEYVTVASEPLEIRVRGTAGGDDPFGGLAKPGDGPPPIVMRDIDARPAKGAAPASLSARGPSVWTLSLALGAVLVGWTVLRTKVRANGDPAGRVVRARRRALGAFERDLRGASGVAEQRIALHQFLAARRGDTPEAWIGRDVLVAADRRVREDGLNDQLHQELAALQEAFDRAEFSSESARAAGAVDAERLRRFARDVVKGGYGS